MDIILEAAELLVLTIKEVAVEAMAKEKLEDSSEESKHFYSYFNINLILMRLIINL